MTDEQKAQAAVRPTVLVGYVGIALTGFAPFQPENSVIFIEEPDVIRKRQAREKAAAAPIVRDLISWEFHLPGKADEFYVTHQDLDPVAVIPLTEYSVEFAARLAERYGLPGATYGAARILRDKAMLRQVSRAAGIANPASEQVRGPSEVRAFMSAHPGPIVLKPANRQASVGTQIIHDAADVDQAWESCVVQDEGVFVPDRPMELRMLAEQYIDGTEYSVEMILRDGQGLFTNVTDKQLYPGPRPVELSQVVPANIDPALATLLGEQTQRMLTAIGYRDGIVHCEWIVADGVPYLVECAGRLPGDGIPDMIERAYGFEMKRHYVEVLKGLPLSAELPKQAKRASAARFLSIEPGLITAVRGVEAAQQTEGLFSLDVDVAPGDRFEGLRSSWDRVGDLIVDADSPTEALRLAEAAAAMIEIDVQGV